MFRTFARLAGVAAIMASLALPGGSVRADGVPVPVVKSPAVIVSEWAGGYAGVETGLGLGKTDVADPYGASIFGDTVRTPEYLIGLEGGYNWQAPASNWVYGVEGDITYQDADGSNTCFATHASVAGVQGTTSSSNCTSNPDWTGSLTARLGYAAGPRGRTLLFGKGGVAFQHNDVEATINNTFVAAGFAPTLRTSTNDTRWGYTLGAGLEQKVSSAWSLKFEYDYYNFSSSSVATSQTIAVTTGGAFILLPATRANVDQNNNVVKLALNYHLNGDPHADWPDDCCDLPRHPQPAMVHGWSFEGGGRYFYSVGRFQKDLAAGPNVAANLISRLTYANLTANSGEFYARADSPWGIFVKGFIGGGGINGGHMNDEDWGLTPPPTAYSNTLSGLSDTSLDYYTIDIGVDVLHGPSHKVGVFVGYNRVNEQYAAPNCTQIADPTNGICFPAINNTPVITETDHWKSMRVGAELIAWLTPDLKLTGEAAYLPYVKFKGVDNHWLRALVIDEKGVGQGGQIEAMLSYYFCPEFSVGVGGRYWEMWTNSGSDQFNGRPTDRQDTFRYERAGAFVQATYQFDPPSREAVPLK